MKFRIFTLFPDMFPGVLGFSLTGKALAAGQWELEVINIRDYALDKHHTVDDTPFGGGAGMLMKAEVIAQAIEHNIPHWQQEPIFYLSPRGKTFNQVQALTLSKMPVINLICGRYEGIDQRSIDYFHLQELSIGNFVLTGGELGAMIIMDSCLRYLPNLLGNQTSLVEESFGGGFADSPYKNLLEYPQYTQPRIWRGLSVPSELLSGNHQLIQQWRQQAAERLTLQRLTEDKH